MEKDLKSKQRSPISVIDTFNECQGKVKYREVTPNELISILLYSKIRSLDYKVVFKELSKFNLNICQQIQNSLLGTSIEEIIFSKDFLSQAIKETIIEIIEENFESFQNFSFDELDDDYILFEESCIFFERYQRQTSSVKSFINTLSCLNSATIPNFFLVDLSSYIDIISLPEVSKITYFNDFISQDYNNLKVSTKFLKLSSICLKSDSNKASIQKFFYSQVKIINNIEILSIIQNFYFSHEVRNLALLRLMLKSCLLGMKKFNDFDVMKRFVDELVSNFTIMINFYINCSDELKNRVRVLMYIMKLFKKHGNFNELFDVYCISSEFFNGKLEKIGKYVKYFYKMMKISLFLGKYEDAIDIWMKNLDSKSSYANKFNFFSIKIKIETGEIKEYHNDLDNIELDNEQKLKIKARLLRRPICEEKFIELIGEEKFKSLIEGNISKKDRWLVEYILEIQRYKGYESCKSIIESLDIFGIGAKYFNVLCRANIQLSIILIIIKYLRRFENTLTLNSIFFTVPKFKNSEMIEIYLKISQIFLKTLNFNDYSAAIKRLCSILKPKSLFPIEAKLKYYKMKSKYNNILGSYHKASKSIRKLSNLIFETKPFPLHLLKYSNFYLQYLLKTSDFQKSLELIEHIQMSSPLGSEKSIFKYEKLKEICQNLSNSQSSIQLQTTFISITQDPKGISNSFPLISLLLKYSSNYELLLKIFLPIQDFFTLYNPTQNLSSFLFAIESCKLLIKLSEYSTSNLLNPIIELQDIINFSFNTLKICESCLAIKTQKSSLLYSKIQKLLARIYILAQEFEIASKYLEKSFNIVVENVGLKDLETGKIYKKSGDLKLNQWKSSQISGDGINYGLLEESREFYENAGKILEQKGFEKGFRMTKLMIAKAECCVWLMEGKRAKELIEKAEGFFESFNNFYETENRWLKRIKDQLV